MTTFDRNENIFVFSLMTCVGRFMLLSIHFINTFLLTTLQKGFLDFATLSASSNLSTWTISLMTIPPTKQETSTFILTSSQSGMKSSSLIDRSMKTHSPTLSNRVSIQWSCCIDTLCYVCKVNYVSFLKCDLLLYVNFLQYVYLNCNNFNSVLNFAFSQTPVTKM